MRSFGRAGRESTDVYFTGGVSAVLLGWRSSTIDIDFSLVPDRDELLRAIPALKEELEINVELASPAHFIPEVPGWRDRSLFIAREGSVSFHHYDFYSQALSKIERDHIQDRSDVEAMFRGGHVEPVRLRELFELIKPNLYRYPAINPDTLSRSVDDVIRKQGS